MLDFLQKYKQSLPLGGKETKENFWALLIEPEWISSSVWQITDGKVEIIASSPATRWDQTSTDSDASLIEAIDGSLSSCTQSLADEIPDPSKTVFGVPNSWIENGNIKDDYLIKLKKICQDLSLVPSGFVVLSEAISHFIKNQESLPLSGIVIGISSNSLDISIFDSSKLIGATSVLRSVSVEEDVVEGLSRLEGDDQSFPSRIILFNQKELELEEIKSNLDSFDWDKLGNNKKFIHTPKVEIFDPAKKILAIALAGGSELGDVTGVFENSPESNLESNGISLSDLNNFDEPKDLTAEDLGFVSSNIEDSPKINTTSIDNTPVFIKQKPKINFKLPKLPTINFDFTKFKKNPSSTKKSIIIVGTIILASLILGIVAWWFLPKATVTIYVSPKKLEEVITVEMNNLQGESVQAEVSGEKTKPTSGTKLIGEKAKGQVKIQNGTKDFVNLQAGTILSSSTDLKFVTLKSASVSAALSTTEPGMATVDVEAYSIGSEYNLSKDEKFKVSNYPRADIEALSITSFSGGSSKQISAVSEEDRKKLLSDLTTELTDKAGTDLKSKISSGMFLIESSLKEDVTNEDFSNKVGDEATSIKLNLTLNVKGIAVSKESLLSTAKLALKEKTPDGFILRDDQISYGFDSTSNANEFEIKIFANLLPNIDTLSISKQIVGKYPHLAEAYLGNIPGFTGAEIKLKPALKGKLGTLPHISKNIVVKLAVEK